MDVFIILAIGVVAGAVGMRAHKDRKLRDLRYSIMRATWMMDQDAQRLKCLEYYTGAVNEYLDTDVPEFLKVLVELKEVWPEDDATPPPDHELRQWFLASMEEGEPRRDGTE